MIRSLRGLVVAASVLAGTTALAVVDDVAPAQAAASCGYATSSYTYSTSVAWWTVDIFKHANRTDACRNGSDITSVWKGYNNCDKYAWGLLYGGGDAYEFSPVNQPVATGTATCWKQVGGSIAGVSLQYKKQSNTQHRFTSSGGVLYVGKSHWTTTP